MNFPIGINVNWVAAMKYFMLGSGTGPNHSSSVMYLSCKGKVSVNICEDRTLGIQIGLF